MKLLLSLIGCLTFLSLPSIWAQSCFPEGLELKSQEEIDNFGSLYPTCRTIEGNLRIESDENTPIVNLRGLNQLEAVGGNLMILLNDSLRDLSGLEHIRTIGDELLISSNSSLTSIESLSGLEAVEDLVIVRNMILPSIAAFGNIQTLNNTLYIEGNPSSDSSAGFP
ncbi:MAG: hypothetical protein AAFR05_21045, partial [Bacteroidota bacterium]